MIGFSLFLTRLSFKFTTFTKLCLRSPTLCHGSTKGHYFLSGRSHSEMKQMWFVNFAYPPKQADQLVLLNLLLRAYVKNLYKKPYPPIIDGLLRDGWYTLSFALGGIHHRLLTRENREGFFWSCIWKGRLFLKHTAHSFHTLIII